MANINQINLITAITKHLAAEHGITHVETRQFNSIIEAATIIVEEFCKSSVWAEDDMGLIKWLGCDDTGASSLYMAHVLAGGPYAKMAYPHDPADFRRCYLFLRAVPEADVTRMSGRGDDQWDRLVDAWVELEALYEKEMDGESAPLLYERLKEVLS